MNALLSNLTKFVSTLMELYSPLPFEMKADLNTLNAYLNSYSQSQQKMLQSFVNRIVERLEAKMKNIVGKQLEECNTIDHYDHILKHYDSCTLKNPDLKLDLQTNQNMKIHGISDRHHFQKDYNQVLTQRSKRLLDQQAIKSDRSKFGSKQRSKITKDANKENTSFDFNFKMDRDVFQQEQKSLKLIKSQMEFLPVVKEQVLRKKSTDVSVKDKRQDKFSKNQIRYQSNENKSNIAHTSSLKIKLKPRPTLDISKLKQGINELYQLYVSQEQQIYKLHIDICSYEQVSKDLINDKL